MKIVMSLQELTSLVIRTYGLPDSSTLEVTNQFHSDAIRMERAFRNALILDEKGDVRDVQKIAAIKLLRELIGVNVCGLAIAKHAIEDWKRFREYVQRKGFPADMSGNVSTPWREN